ncbi:MAG: TNT domain-containing protein, partial [Sciscionella sp.]
MGIELPGELADVAAKAGARWPDADEDAMREAAQAWRDTGRKVDALSGEADGAAKDALRAVQGTAADAVRKHWDTFIKPDTGHLSAVSVGCDAAADRLDHAAEQIGAAKVEMLRSLVHLARNIDAAHVAAASGEPGALAGLDAAVRGTAVNVAHVYDTLVQAVRKDSGVTVADGAASMPVTRAA